MSTHITIHTDQGVMVWPIARVHLNHRKEDEKFDPSHGYPAGYKLVSPETVMFDITKEEYERVQKLLTDPMEE